MNVFVQASYDNHPADMGTKTFERGRDLAVKQTLSSELKQVNAALSKIDKGEDTPDQNLRMAIWIMQTPGKLLKSLELLIPLLWPPNAMLKTTPRACKM